MAAQSVGRTEPPDVEEILCQCFYAMGTGAGMPIKSEAIAALRERYRGHFQTELAKDPAAWDQEGHYVLEYSRAIGRLAAQKAVARGATRIGRTDAVEASIKVQEWVQGELAKATRFCV